MRIAHVLLLLTLATSAARAQTFEQLGFLRLNDTTPKSTRTTALGGATDALESDAADVAINPATLASIKRAAFVVQGARNSITYNQYFSRPDDTPGFRSAWRTSSDVSQVAVAFPVRGAVIGAYYASEPELNGFEPLVNVFGGSPYTAPECPNGCDYLLPVAGSAFDRHDRRYGVAFGWEHGALSIGAGAEMRHIDERSNVGRAVIGTGSLDAVNELLVRRIDDRAIAPNVGLRWRITPRVAFSAAYNGSGNFSRDTSACNVANYQWNACASSLALIGHSTVRMPDAYRAGITVVPIGALRLVGEAVRHDYSRLATDEYSIFGGEQKLAYRDVTELHAGAEYRLSSLPVVLRAGWWRDPSRYASPFVAAGQTVHHYTGGIGFHVGSARVDLAYDDSHVALQRRAMVSVGFDL